MFIKGTQPKAALARGLRHRGPARQVGQLRDPSKSWMAADLDWLARRAERGPGVRGGPNRTQTSYFYNFQFQPYGASWGVLVGGACGRPSPTPSCFVVPTPDASGVVPSFAVAVGRRVVRGRAALSATVRPAVRGAVRLARAEPERRGLRATATDRSADRGAHRSTDRAPTEAPTPGARPRRRPRRRPSRRRPTAADPGSDGQERRLAAP